MPAVLKNIIFLLTLKGRRKVLLLLAGMIVVAIFEVLGVVSVMPFIGVASQPEMIETQPLLRQLYQMTGAETPRDFLIMLGVGMIVLLIMANLTAAIVNASLLRFTHWRGHEISNELLCKAVDKPYLYFLAHNTSFISKMVLNQVAQIVNGALIPSLQLMARVIALSFMLALLLAVDSKITLIILGGLGSFYAVLFFLMRRHIIRIGRRALEAETQRHKAVAEVLGGIKEVKLLGHEKIFIDRFSVPSALAARYSGTKETLALMPRYLLEAIAFSAMVGVVLFLLEGKQSLNEVLPVLALYALIGIRMMPAVQQLFHNITIIRYSAPALAEICELVQDDKKIPDHTAQPLVPLQSHIRLQHLSFFYPEKTDSVLKDISLTIPARKLTALVGSTGSGKSTLADVLTGMLTAQSGHILIDDTPLTETNMRGWQNGIGYVPQHIFLLDDTIRRNIVFGIADEAIDEVAVARVAQMAQIDGFIQSELKDGYDTVVGERGIRLSGGQRQRIGLARALYHNPQLLVLDEATSALDNVTERSVMDAIHALGGKKTVIVIAHRLSTVQQCDQVILLEQGRIVAQGTYDELLKNSATFQKLAHAIEENKDAAKGR